MVVSGILRPIARSSSRFLPHLLNDVRLATHTKDVICSCPRNTFTPVVLHYRGFFSFPGSGSLTKEHSEKKLIGYSMEQMYDIVADVDQYKNFVPFCTGSHVFQRSETHARANLEVGFQMVKESYTSVLTLAPPNLVKSECMDGTLFNYLKCVWKFSKGPPDMPNSCTLDFYISFEFKSVLHSQLANVFFEQVVMKMVDAFLARAKHLHGPSSLEGGPRRVPAAAAAVPPPQPQLKKQQPRTRIAPRKRRVVEIPK